MAVLRIATDSTADVPAALAAELQIAVIPCQVFWGEEVYRDGVDLPPQEFYQKLARSVDLPKTSQPPVSRFVETYDRLLGHGGERGSHLDPRCGQSQRHGQCCLGSCPDTDRSLAN